MEVIGTGKLEAIRALTYTTVQELYLALDTTQVEDVPQVVRQLRMQFQRKSGVDRQEATVTRNLLITYFTEEPEARQFFKFWGLAIENNDSLLSGELLQLFNAMLQIAKGSTVHDTGVALGNRIIQNCLATMYEYLNPRNPRLTSHTLVLLKTLVQYDPILANTLVNIFNFEFSGVHAVARFHRRNADPSVTVNPKSFYDNEQDVRVLYVRFILAFIEYGNRHTKDTLLAKSQVMTSLFESLSGDPYYNVFLVFRVFHDHVLSDPAIGQRTCASIFNNKIMAGITQLYQDNDTIWVSAPSIPRLLNIYLSPKQPQKALHVLLPDVANELLEKQQVFSEEQFKDTARSLTDRFLRRLCTTPGFALCFMEYGWYQARENGPDAASEDAIAAGELPEGQSVISSAPRATKVEPVNRRLLQIAAHVLKPRHHIEHQRLLLAIFEACPELVSLYWSAHTLSFEPRLSTNLIGNVGLAVRVLDLPIPHRLVGRNPTGRLSRHAISVFSMPPPTATVVDNILPVELLRTCLGKGLQHPSELVRYSMLVLLAQAFNKLGRVLVFWDTQINQIHLAGLQVSKFMTAWTNTRKEILDLFRRGLPDLALVVKLHLALSDVSPTQVTHESRRHNIMREILLKILNGYERYFPEVAAESHLDYCELIPSVEGIATLGQVQAEISHFVLAQSGGTQKPKLDYTSLAVVRSLKRVLDSIYYAPDLRWNRYPNSKTNDTDSSPKLTYFSHLMLLRLVSSLPDIADQVETVLLKFLTDSMLFKEHPLEALVWCRTLATYFSPLRYASHGSTTESEQWQDAQRFLAMLDSVMDRCQRLVFAYTDRLTALSEQVTDVCTNLSGQPAALGNESSNNPESRATQLLTAYGAHPWPKTGTQGSAQFDTTASQLTGTAGQQDTVNSLPFSPLLLALLDKVGYLVQQFSSAECDQSDLAEHDVYHHIRFTTLLVVQVAQAAGSRIPILVLYDKFIREIGGVFLTSQAPCPGEPLPTLVQVAQSVGDEGSPRRALWDLLYATWLYLTRDVPSELLSALVPTYAEDMALVAEGTTPESTIDVSHLLATLVPQVVAKPTRVFRHMENVSSMVMIPLFQTILADSELQEQSEHHALVEQAFHWYVATQPPVLSTLDARLGRLLFVSTFQSDSDSGELAAQMPCATLLARLTLKQLLDQDLQLLVSHSLTKAISRLQRAVTANESMSGTMSVQELELIRFIVQTVNAVLDRCQTVYAAGLPWPLVGRSFEFFFGILAKLVDALESDGQTVSNGGSHATARAVGVALTCHPMFQVCFDILARPDTLDRTQSENIRKLVSRVIGYLATQRESATTMMTSAFSLWGPLLSSTRDGLLSSLHTIQAVLKSSAAQPQSALTEAWSDVVRYARLFLTLEPLYDSEDILVLGQFLVKNYTFIADALPESHRGRFLHTITRLLLRIYRNREILFSQSQEVFHQVFVTLVGLYQHTSNPRLLKKLDTLLNTIVGWIVPPLPLPEAVARLIAKSHPTTISSLSIGASGLPLTGTPSTFQTRKQGVFGKMGFARMPVVPLVSTALGNLRQSNVAMLCRLVTTHGSARVAVRDWLLEHMKTTSKKLLQAVITTPSTGNQSITGVLFLGVVRCYLEVVLPEMTDKDRPTWPTFTTSEDLQLLEWLVKNLFQLWDGPKSKLSSSKPLLVQLVTDVQYQLVKAALLLNCTSKKLLSYASCYLRYVEQSDDQQVVVHGLGLLTVWTQLSNDSLPMSLYSMGWSMVAALIQPDNSSPTKSSHRAVTPTLANQVCALCSLEMEGTIPSETRQPAWAILKTLTTSRWHIFSSAAMRMAVSVLTFLDSRHPDYPHILECLMTSLSSAIHDQSTNITPGGSRTTAKDTSLPDLVGTPPTTFFVVFSILWSRCRPNKRLVAYLQILLPYYTATLGVRDQLILRLLVQYEREHRASLATLAALWGPLSRPQHWGSILKDPKANFEEERPNKLVTVRYVQDSLLCLDSTLMNYTVLHYPTDLSLETDALFSAVNPTTAASEEPHNRSNPNLAASPE
ncbi:hypothetical protein IWQ62_003604, partial [Dispira parvispora]